MAAWAMSDVRQRLGAQFLLPAVQAEITFTIERTRSSSRVEHRNFEVLDFFQVLKLLQNILNYKVTLKAQNMAKLW